jgi:hypothetical protein
MPLGAFKAALMGTAGVSTADVVLLATATADGSSALEFTSGITSTYGEYIFGFYNLHPSADGHIFQFQGSIDGGSNYNVATTTTMFKGRHREDDSEATLTYDTGQDKAQDTGVIPLSLGAANDNDSQTSGIFHLFNPASTTYVKHFTSRTMAFTDADICHDTFVAGYINSTSAVDAIKFVMASGNIDTGKIKMWGVK